MNWLVFLFFFISGACGLIYEVVWSRMMALIFGRSVLAVGIVLAAFMSGLALGSYLLGKYADRNRNLVRLYAFYEIGVGITAFIASFLLTRIAPVHVWLHSAIPAFPFVQALARFAIVFSLLILPTTLMGATLPILSRLLVTRLSHIGLELGRLYAVNTVGAIAGSLTAGFYLIKRFGLHGAVDLAVFGNLAVGVFALLASRRFNPVDVTDSSPYPVDSALRTTRPDPEARRTYCLLLVAFGLSGVASFAYEIFWTRSLVFLLGNTTYSFTLMLTAFLSGIAIGGYAIRFVADIVKHPLRLFAVIEILIGIFSSIALPLLFFILKSEAVRNFVMRFSGTLDLLAVSNFVIALSVMLLPAILIGATLPLLGRIFVSDLKKTGATIGTLYAVNTLGNVAGALLPGLLIMPVMGIQKGILLMAALNIGVGIVLMLSRAKFLPAVVSACVVLFMAFGVVLVRMPISFQFPSEYQRARDEVLYYREGGLVTTKVWTSADTGYKVISVDGINIGGTGDSDYKQQILAHLPKLLLKSYSSELSIGLGSGILIGESGRHEALKKIVCVEISQGVAEGARYFAKENYNIMNDPRTVIVVDDIAGFLQTTTDRFDIITADEKTTGKYASNSFSYSKEYYKLLRRRLAPGGLAIQWMPTDLPPSQYRLAIRTFLDEFPHVHLWYFPPVGRFTMTNTLLVGSNEPVEIDPAWMRQTLEADPESFKGMSKYGLTTAEAVLAHYVAGDDILRRIMPPGPVNTFEKPLYEFYSPGEYAAPVNERTLVNHDLLMSAWEADSDRFLSAMSGQEQLRLSAALKAEEMFLKGHRDQLLGAPTENVMKQYDQAIAVAPWNRNLRNEVRAYLNNQYLACYFNSDYTRGMAFLRAAAEIYPESDEVHYDYGWMLLKMNQARLAVDELRRSLAIKSTVVPVRRLLASLYAERGEVEKAMEEWKIALSLDPNDIATLVSYGIFLAEHRSSIQAIQYARKAYELDSEDPDVIDGYARVEYLSGNLPEARRIVLKGGNYYVGNPFFEQLRMAILGKN